MKRELNRQFQSDPRRSVRASDRPRAELLLDLCQLHFQPAPFRGGSAVVR